MSSVDNSVVWRDFVTYRQEAKEFDLEYDHLSGPGSRPLQAARCQSIQICQHGASSQQIRLK